MYEVLNLQIKDFRGAWSKIFADYKPQKACIAGEYLPFDINVVSIMFMECRGIPSELNKKYLEVKYYNRKPIDK